MTFLPNELDSLDEIDTFLEKKKKKHQLPKVTQNGKPEKTYIYYEK